MEILAIPSSILGIAGFSSSIWRGYNTFMHFIQAADVKMWKRFEYTKVLYAQLCSS